MTENGKNRGKQLSALAIEPGFAVTPR